MTSRDFIYWLQGFFEVSNTDSVTPEQVKIIKNHLSLVFKHEIDPSIDGGNPIKQNELQLLHDGKIPYPPWSLTAGDHHVATGGTTYRC